MLIVFLGIVVVALIILMIDERKCKKIEKTKNKATISRKM